MARDRGVYPDLLNRHFGEAGNGSALTEAQRHRIIRQDAAKLTEMQKNKPLHPPGRKPVAKAQ